MNATDKHHLPVSDATTDAMTHTADVAPVVPHQQAVDHLSETAKIRRRCPFWLYGECRGGQECKCIPPITAEPSS